MHNTSWLALIAQNCVISGRLPQYARSGRINGVILTAMNTEDSDVAGFWFGESEDDDASWCR